MLTGPIFSRELLTAPRKLRHCLLRSGYVAALFVLMYTTRQSTIGFQDVQNIGDIARFGALVFQVFSIIQLTLVLFFSLLFTASNIAQEKDRGTLVLLLMTDLRDRELVLGKLGAGLLVVGVLLATSAPVFCLLHMLGGVGLDQILWSLALCAATALAAGSWGALVAFWREKTFQTLAISVLGVVLFVGAIEGVVRIVGPETMLGSTVALFNPYRSLADLLNPLAAAGLEPARVTALAPVLALLGFAVTLVLFTMNRLRVWNPSQAVMQRAAETDAAAAEFGRVRHRRIWNNPVIWREMRTRAYGHKVALIKLCYVALAMFVAYSVIGSPPRGELVLGMISPAGFAFVGLGVLSLLLINAQAVTSLTSERDMKTLELLLVTDISAREFIYGKIGGALYNARETILIPLALVVYYSVTGFVPELSVENLIYVVVGFLSLVFFATMLGLHSGLSFDNSRAGITNSLGTIFFLFIGIFIFMILLVEARSSFALQLQSFLVFIGAGSIGLYASLTHKNPSNALTLAAGLLPFLTFYAITEFFLQGTLGVCLWITVAYGFTTIAMLVPAISDFDVVLGRTTLDKG